jgi:hypothetical protein
MGAKRDRTQSEKVYAMSCQGDQPMKNDPQIQIPTHEIERAVAELRQRLAEIQTAVRRLEEAKVVSQETMQKEVSI